MSAYVNAEYQDNDLMKKFKSILGKQAVSQIEKTIEQQEKTEAKYVDVSKPILDKLKSLDTAVQKSSGPRGDASILGSMTGTGPGYSWSNAPGRIVTAAEQLPVAIATGVAVAGAATPTGMLIALGVGAWRAGGLPTWQQPQ